MSDSISLPPPKAESVFVRHCPASLPRRLCVWVSGGGACGAKFPCGGPAAIRTCLVILFALCGACRRAPTEPAPRVPSSVALSSTTLSFVSLGETKQLTASVIDQDGELLDGMAVTWSSSHTQVATVSSAGLVTAVADGLATITAAVGSVSATATVTVIAPGFGLDQFQVVVAGTFSMGYCELGRQCIYRGAQPVHTVTLTRAFYLQTTEVTQGQWRAIMGSNPSQFGGCDRCPVENVSWDDIQEFLAKLNAAEPDADFRLPTEAEWEYACRAGTTGAFGGTGELDDMGWTFTNSGNHPHEVATKQPNAWGLYDMHGNVWEWVQDWRGPYPADPVSDPQGPGTGTTKDVRGGGFNSALGRDSSCYRRRNEEPSYQRGTLGFRLARGSRDLGVASVAVSPLNASVESGGSIQFIATVLDANGGPKIQLTFWHNITYFRLVSKNMCQSSVANADSLVGTVVLRRRDRSLPRNQAGHGLQVDRRKADAGTPDGAPLEISQGGSRRMGEIRRSRRDKGSGT